MYLCLINFKLFYMRIKIINKFKRTSKGWKWSIKAGLKVKKMLKSRPPLFIFLFSDLIFLFETFFPFCILVFFFLLKVKNFVQKLIFKNSLDCYLNSELINDLSKKFENLVKPLFYWVFESLQNF